MLYIITQMKIRNKIIRKKLKSFLWIHNSLKTQNKAISSLLFQLNSLRIIVSYKINNTNEFWLNFLFFQKGLYVLKVKDYFPFKKLLDQAMEKLDTISQLLIKAQWLFIQSDIKKYQFSVQMLRISLNLNK